MNDAELADRRARLIRQNSKQMVMDILNEANDWVIFGERSPSWQELRDSILNALFDIENQNGYEAGVIDSINEGRR